MANDTSTIENAGNTSNEGGYKIAVNSIQRTKYVERLCVNIAYPSDRIIPYDKDNLYPQKIKSIAYRSGSAISAINKYSSFIAGNGFTGMDTIVNRERQTLWDILDHMANTFAMFGGIALHFNFNVFGQIYEINPYNFEFVRWHKDLKRLQCSNDWPRRYTNRRNEITYNPFNPEEVLKEIEEAGGFQNYKGQIFYWIPNKKDWYTVCPWDSAIDDAQFEAEAKLYGLSSLQNDYSLGGLVAVPEGLTSKKQVDAIKEDYRGDMGAKNAGGIRVVSAMPAEGLSNWRWFTPISRNNIDTLHTNQKETAKLNIYHSLSQPPILSGIATNGMFNQESFMDAFHYYNSETEGKRKTVEGLLTEILSYSIWNNIVPVQIQPKEYLGREKNKF